jgi:hypothetical protein
MSLSMANAAEINSRKLHAISLLDCRQYEVDNYEDREGKQLFSEPALKSLKPALRKAYTKSKPKASPHSSAHQSSSSQRKHSSVSKTFFARPKFNKPSRGGLQKREKKSKQE